MIWGGSKSACRRTEGDGEGRGQLSGIFKSFNMYPILNNFDLGHHIHGESSKDTAPLRWKSLDALAAVVRYTKNIITVIRMSTRFYPCAFSSRFTEIPEVSTHEVAALATNVVPMGHGLLVDCSNSKRYVESGG